VNSEFEAWKAALTNCVWHGLESGNQRGIHDFPAYVQGRGAQVQAIHRGRKTCLRAILPESEVSAPPWACRSQRDLI